MKTFNFRARKDSRVLGVIVRKKCDVASKCQCPFFVLLQHFLKIEVSRPHVGVSFTLHAVTARGIKLDISGEVATKIFKYIRNMIQSNQHNTYFLALKNVLFYY